MASDVPSSSVTPSQSPQNIPSFKSTLSESYRSLSRNFVKVFGLSISAALLQLLLTGLLLLGLFLIFKGFPFNLNVVRKLNVEKDFPQLGALLVETFWPFFQARLGQTIALLSLYWLMMLLVSSVTQIAIIRIFYDQEGQVGVFSALAVGLRKFLLFIFLNLIVGLLSLGGLFIFIVPALLFYFLFAFAPYVLVVEDSGIINSMRRSVKLVSTYFGEIFLRGLLFIVGYVLLVFVVPAWLVKQDSSLVLYGIFFRLLAQFVLNWFAAAFFVTLYRQAKGSLPAAETARVLWIVILSLIGWLLALVLSVFAYRALMDLKPWEKFLQVYQRSQEAESRVGTVVPSSCGLSLPIPKTKDVKDGQERKWLYEELPLVRDEFYILGSGVHPVKTVVGAFLAYRAEDEKLTERISYPGFNIYCTENPKGLSLEEFVALAKVNQKYQIESTQDYRFGEVALVFMPVSATDAKGNQLNDRIHLAVSADKNRLIVLRIWSAAEDDPLAQELEKDTEIISSGLKYREVTKELTPPQAGSTQPQRGAGSSSSKASCTRYPIREGKFTSDKCYSAKDYEDLIYYLNRYNTAAASYNSAVASMGITCSGSDFFKNQCEADKKQKEQAEKDLASYEGTINGIIAKGK